MWKLSKHLKLSRAHSELESLLLERTAALQNLSHRLLIVQDEERRKIARELHDNTGQTLAALRMAISAGILQSKLGHAGTRFRCCATGRSSTG
jgi:signal transduction histidine kinase